MLQDCDCLVCSLILPTCHVWILLVCQDLMSTPSPGSRPAALFLFACRQSHSHSPSLNDNCCVKDLPNLAKLIFMFIYEDLSYPYFWFWPYQQRTNSQYYSPSRHRCCTRCHAVISSGKKPADIPNKYVVSNPPSLMSFLVLIPTDWPSSTLLQAKASL